MDELCGVPCSAWLLAQATKLAVPTVEGTVPIESGNPYSYLALCIHGDEGP